MTIGDLADQRQARWVGLTKVLAKADRETIEALARLAFATRQTPSAASLQGIRQMFKDADETFPSVGNDREMQVLAAACLAVLVGDMAADEAPAAALVVCTTSLGGARNPDLPMDLASIGRAAVRALGEVRRKRPDLASLANLASPKVDFEKSAAKVRENNWEPVAQAFLLAATSTQTALGAVATRNANAMRVLDTYLRSQDEELQMLWWLVGEHCYVHGVAFEEVPATNRPLIFAASLADMTEALPGPGAVAGILARAGLRSHEPLEVAAAVNSAMTSWLEPLVKDQTISPVSAPLHFALARRLETGAGADWIRGWAATCAVDADFALPPLALAQQFYCERLLMLFE
ncbi:MAG: hypothetical protein IH627_12070 [Rubrivivax sp.]|nr:hypothetical protein [Rubrivivax sp.]